MNLTKSIPFVQNRSGVVGTDTIQSAGLKTAFYLDDGRPSPNPMRTSAGWRFSCEGAFVIAERGVSERYFIPLENVAGLSAPRAASTPSTQLPDDACRDHAGEPEADHSATKQLATEASSRARGRSARR